MPTVSVGLRWVLFQALGTGRKTRKGFGKQPEKILGLLPIEWVKREKTTPSHRPREGCRPGPGQLSSGRGRPGKLKIFLKHPLDWEKTQIFYPPRRKNLTKDFFCSYVGGKGMVRPSREFLIFLLNG
jgi:hypothetical protein